MVSKSVFGSLMLASVLSLTLGVAAAAEPVGKIARIQGSAVVSQGAQYVVASEGMSLREGDRLMALEGGTVTIQFVDGCRLALSDNEVLTVGAVSSCASEAVGNYGVDPSSGVAQAPNAQGYLRRAALEPPTPPPPPPVAVIPGIGVGWVVPVAVVGAAAAIAASDDDGTPASP